MPVIIVKMRGTDITFKDVTVKKQKVHDALLWLIDNNRQYSDVTMNNKCLSMLPENGIPSDLLICETKHEIV